MIEAAGLPHTNDLVLALTVTIALSVFAHGVTAAPLARIYAASQSFEQSSETPRMESKATPTQRWRHGRRSAPQ